MSPEERLNFHEEMDAWNMKCGLTDEAFRAAFRMLEAIKAYEEAFKQEDTQASHELLHEVVNELDMTYDIIMSLQELMTYNKIG